MSSHSCPIIAITPFEFADASLVIASCRGGALGVLDLGRDPIARAAALERVASQIENFGVRVPLGVAVNPDTLPTSVGTVVVPAGVDVSRFGGRRVLVQVTSIEEARVAARAGAAAVIATGNESGGRVGAETAFVLLQRCVAELDLPVWVQGGIGMHTAAACIAGGARGVVIDSQLALVRESSLPTEVKGAIYTMDGSETVLAGGYRLFTRPDLPIASLSDATPDEILPKLGGASLRDNFVPAGQDAAFARSFADRFRTAGGVVQAIARSITAHIEAAQRTQPLAPNAPLAQALGTRYPIAQGPMTRVSDRAAFADAVASGGGMPFVALALMSGEQTRELLTETAALLGDKPWGVGILGFVPPSVREAQLEVLRDIKPPVALIAGGRPAQAKPLEEQGTSTYLHVPSPGLLDLFLKDGARKFIFEGRECGGHVGPRSSFALWEAQIDRLLAFDKPEQLHVIFAGGIHDARSAAMVAAMAAPLAEAGAKLGVLMGTAYLFTEEAVASGAIKPGFQQAALGCERTVLLETSPGHATRCVESDYVRAFRAEKQRLQAAGKSSQEMWMELEQLNLGRLRIASKGVVRDGGKLVEVDERAQQRDGMFMIGQVAALRGGTCTIADLHADVAEGSAARLDALSTDGDEVVAANPADVAIVGMACMFPGAPDTQAFWANVVNGVNSVTEVPKTRWNPDLYYDPEAVGANAGKKTPSKWGGFLPTVDFDPLAYGIPPKSLAAIEPVQLLSLEVARRALADAGYADREFERERSSVIFGAEAGTDLSGAYGFRAVYPQLAGALPESLDEHLPTLTEDSFPGVLANVIAGRIANRLDLGGVNYTVDAACASSLAAVDLAVKELVAGTSDMVLCGGADVHNSINDYLLFSSVHALSPRGQCRTFDASADGIALGEGVGCLVLKRLSDAERDGDRIYAVIKGIAGSSDGRSLGLTAPRKEGQVRAFERAYGRAGVSPAEVGLVEAHGTGTVVGDRTELQTLTEVYTDAGAQAGSCALGSVKSNIGHTKCAAGMAGMIKAALSLHAGVRPPTLNIEDPNPAWEPGKSPFHFGDQARPWPADRRRAAVSALGFGGTNFHAVLAAYEGAERPDIGVNEWPSELFLFRGADRAAAVERVAQVERALDTDKEPRLRDLARSVVELGGGPVQIAVVADSVRDLRGKLVAAKALEADGESVFVADDAAEPGKLAYLFPGQGSQRIGMLADVFVAFPRLQRYLRLGSHLVDTIFPPQAFSREQEKAQQAALTDTRAAQPALGMVDLAMADLLGSLGVTADMLGGHSYGELVALCSAGVFGPEQLIALSEARAKCILDAAGDDPGTMAAVSGAADAVEKRIHEFEGVVIANRNSPRQTVISGPTEAVEKMVEALQANNVAARRIPVACAFHSPVVAGASKTLAARLAEVEFAEPSAPVWANATAAPYPADAGEARALLASQVAKPVRFAEQIEAMYAAGARTFVEVGPGRVLSGLVEKILGDRPHRAIACDVKGDHGVRRLLRALAELAVSGAPVVPAALFVGRDTEVLDMSQALPGRAKSTWEVNGYTAKPIVGEPPKGAFVPVEEPIAVPATTRAGSATGARETAMVEYLRGMREMVTAQKDVMLAFLGQQPGAQPVVQAPVVEAPVVEAPVVEAPAEAPAVSVSETLMAIVSERTGYPTEMLDLDLDLEAELSIDSIKRIEILGELRDKVGIAAKGDQSDEEIIEQLASLKTLRGIIEWLEENTGAGSSTSTSTSTSTEAPEVVDAIPMARYLLKVEEAPPPALNGTTLDGKKFVITDDGRGIAMRMAAMLESYGANAQVIAAEQGLDGDVDGLIHLETLALGATPETVKRLFGLAREAALGGAHWIVAATPLGGMFGHTVTSDSSLLLGGTAGLLKTVAREFPEIKVRIIDVDPEADAGEIATRFRTELLVIDKFVEVGYADGVRYQLRAVAADAPSGGSDLQLDKDSVVLVTGGARGITAKVAVELARRYQCRLELVGRSPLPPEREDPAFAGAPDAMALRKLLVARGQRDPAAIEAECRRILAARQIRDTLASIEEAGGTVGYHSIDVRDCAVFGALIDTIYARRGRIDGVIHGAGVLEDKLIRDKTPESFERVFDTKVAAALTLALKIRSDARFVVLFSSISGVFGNKGQVDYAAANDALDKLSWSLNHRVAGRVVAINWGPWGGTGMVSEELQREYARRGIGLIDPAAGVDRLLAELKSDSDAHSQVVLMCADAEALQTMPSRPSEADDASDAADRAGLDG